MAMNSMQSQPNYPKEVLELPVYHANIRSRDDAKDYMKKHHQGEGSYFFRPNTSNDPTFVSITVSISPDGECCHAKVYIEKKKSTAFYISEKQKFLTLRDLLSYYADHRIHCTQNIDNIKLKKPLNYQRTQSTRQSLGNTFSTPTNGLNIVIQNNIPTEHERPTRPPNIPSKQKRANSLSQSVPQNRQTFQTQFSENSLSHSSHNIDSFRSVSESDIPNLNNTKYANANVVQQNVKMIIKCLPPPPLPKLDLSKGSEDNDFYYTHVDANKNFFEETYQFLKQNELCECGLRSVDSEFPLDWTVHRSQEPSTKNRIFFQHGDQTTWEMPSQIVPHLNFSQIQFILFLCREGKCPIPDCLKPRLKNEIEKKKTLTLSSYRKQIIDNDETMLKTPFDHEETFMKRNASDRPLSFDSLPTTSVSPIVGSPAPGFQDSQVNLRKKQEDVQQKLLNHELEELRSFENISKGQVGNFRLTKKK